MQRCRECGMPVEFRFIDGRCIPMHTDGGCSGSGQNLNSTGTRRSTESECRKTTCPKCKMAVYFIRHNGGSVWIEPPLGPPWDRYPCMAEPVSGTKDTPLISPDLLAQLGEHRGLITGVVKGSEISKDRRQTILEIILGADEALSILVKGGANSLLGQIVIITPKDRQIHSAAIAPFSLKITAALAGPEAVVGRGAPLHLPLSPDEIDKVRSDIKHGELSDKHHHARRKHQRQGLTGNWKLAEILMLIPLLTGKDKDRAVHKAAVMIIDQAESHGDCSGAATLVSALPPAKREQVSTWFWRFSPIRIDLSRKRRKAYIFKTSEGVHRPFLTDTARNTPI